MMSCPRCIYNSLKAAVEKHRPGRTVAISDHINGGQELIEVDSKTGQPVADPIARYWFADPIPSVCTCLIPLLTLGVSPTKEDIEEYMERMKVDEADPPSAFIAAIGGQDVFDNIKSVISDERERLAEIYFNTTGDDVYLKEIG